MHLNPYRLGVLTLVAALAGCQQPAEPNPEMAELLVLLRQQQQNAQNAQTAPVATPLPPGSIPGGQPMGDPGRTPRIPPPTGTPGAGIAPGQPGAPSPLLYAAPDQAESQLDDLSRLVLPGTAWSIGSAVPPFLRDRELPAASFLTFLDRQVHLHTPAGVYAYDVDYWPGDLLCRRLRPCIAVTGANDRVYPMWYEISAGQGEDRTQRIHFLNCIRIEEAEGGAFPSDELLQQNGGLRAVHRTPTQLCVRPIDDPGLVSLALGDTPGNRTPPAGNPP